MNKTKIKKFRHQQRMKKVAEEQQYKQLQERKAILLVKKKKHKAETKQRSSKFFDDFFNKWDSQRSHENAAIPSLISDSWGKCTKKKSPLDDY